MLEEVRHEHEFVRSPAILDTRVNGSGLEGLVQVADGVRVDLDGVVLEAPLGEGGGQGRCHVAEAGTEIDDAHGITVREMADKESRSGLRLPRKLRKVFRIGAVLPVGAVVGFEFAVGGQRMHADEIAPEAAHDDFSREARSGAAVRLHR